MKNSKYFNALITYIAFLFLFFPILGKAENSDENNKEDAYFSFEVLFPENQIDRAIGYYDLKMEPGQQQNLEIRLSNPSPAEVTVQVDLNGAKTNTSGVIEYGPTDIKNDASLQFPFEEIAKAPEEITLAPGEEQILSIEINMPESSIEGYISGGVRLMRKGQGEGSESMVVNEIAYMVGILLTEQETAEINAIPEDMKFNQVKPNSYNYRNSFMVNFSNTKPIYVEDMTVDVQISKEGNSQVLYDSKKSQMRMAPNTMIDFPVSLNGEEMVAGDYRAKIVVTSGKGGKWEWDEPFTVTDEEADKFNAQDLSLVQDPGLDWKLIAVIAGGVLGLLLVIFLIVHFAKKQKKNKRTKKGPNGSKK